VTAGPSPLAAAVTLGLTVGVFAASFGVLAVSSGLTVVQASAMSLLVFTGASQFAFVGLVGTGSTPATALGTALLLSARNFAYGLALAPALRGSLTKRLVASHFVLDESTALALAEPDRPRQELAFWAAGLSIFVCWNVGTVLGALGGQAIGDPKTLGLDAAFPAGFVALLVPHLRTLDGKLAALLAAGLTLLLIPAVPEGAPILVAALAVLVGLRPR
jgi:4-azaleucine resistance transporter AzlC